VKIYPLCFSALLLLPMFLQQHQPGERRQGPPLLRTDTLVIFALEEVANTVMLTVTELGFDRIPLASRGLQCERAEVGT
jgi:hypothetical protein